MFDTYEIIVKDFGDRAANHILQQLHFLNLNLKKLMDQYSDLKATIDLVRDDVTQIKTKVNAFIDGLPTSGGMTQAQIDDLKQELTNVDTDVKFVTSRIDSATIPAVTPPVVTPPVDVPPVQNPPVDNPPVDNPPVDNPPVDVPPVDNPPIDTPPVQEPPADVPPVNQQPAE